jgi:hypothetical protein
VHCRAEAWNVVVPSRLFLNTGPTNAADPADAALGYVIKEIAANEVRLAQYGTIHGTASCAELPWVTLIGVVVG